MAEMESTATGRPQRYRGMRVLRVLRTAAVTPHMRRITLGGDEIAGISRGPNIKLLIPPPGLAEPEWPMAGANGRAIWPAADKRPAVRTYSVRRFDPGAGELDVDFVLHGHGGPASRWASDAKPGDVLGIGGPGGRTVADADWYLLAGDHTALPAISAILETLPAAARGHAIIEVPDAQEEQAITFDAEHHRRMAASQRRRGRTHDPVARRGPPRRLAVRRANFRLGRLQIGKRAGDPLLCARRARPRPAAVPRGRLLALRHGRDGYKDAHNNDRDEDYFAALREEQHAKAPAAASAGPDRD